MRATSITNMFHGFTYPKTTEEIKTAVKAKVEKLKAKIEERTERVANLRKEYDITDSDLVQLLTAARKQQGAQAYTYSKGSVSDNGQAQMEEKTIGAGVVNNLLTEQDFIEAERDQVSTLELIVRNLKAQTMVQNGVIVGPVDQFMLSQEELRYLGF